MPWKAPSPMDLRRELIKRIADGEKPADVRRAYGISKKTMNKFRARYARFGDEGLRDQSRAPHVIPHKTGPEVVEVLIAERTRHPTWGPKKLKDVLEKRLERTLPSASTIGNVLVQHGLVARRRRPAHVARATGLAVAVAPNDTWCIDYKGQFRTRDRRYCYPLTITDQVSRFVLAAEGMPAISDEDARDVCRDVVRQHGLPTRMRSDNGNPFASVGLAGLTRLSVFWLRLGIGRELIRRGHPEDNGRHERMHLTLKRDTTRPARGNVLLQQERFDEWREEFNRERPHEALGMKRPSEVYVPSPRPYPAVVPEPTYPTHDDTLVVGPRGCIKLGRAQVYLCAPLAGEVVGVREQLDGAWLVSFANLDLGTVRDGRLVPLGVPVPPPNETNDL
jgi:transposase InsO family protein